MLIADFGGSVLITLLSSKGLVPYKYIYLTLIPISVIGLIIGYTSMKKGEKEDAALTANAASEEPAPAE